MLRLNAGVNITQTLKFSRVVLFIDLIANNYHVHEFISIFAWSDTIKTYTET